LIVFRELEMFGQDVFWIQGEPWVNLAVVIMPRPEDWLEEDLRSYAQIGIGLVVSLLEPREAAWLGVGDEETLAYQVGMEFLNYPIPDGHVPNDIVGFRAFVSELAERLRAGRSIGVHCRGSIGRSTVTAACTLIHLGWEPGAAIEAIRHARGLDVPDTEEQRRWIMKYEAEP
jgi:protein-tyrosine phosphatase